jgi:hypothetical protein
VQDSWDAGSLRCRTANGVCLDATKAYPKVPAPVKQRLEFALSRFSGLRSWNVFNRAGERIYNDIGGDPVNIFINSIGKRVADVDGRYLSYVVAYKMNYDAIFQRRLSHFI